MGNNDFLLFRGSCPRSRVDAGRRFLLSVRISRCTGRVHDYGLRVPGSRGKLFADRDVDGILFLTTNLRRGTAAAWFRAD